MGTVLTGSLFAQIALAALLIPPAAPASGTGNPLVDPWIPAFLHHGPESILLFQDGEDRIHDGAPVRGQPRRHLGRVGALLHCLQSETSPAEPSPALPPESRARILGDAGPPTPPPGVPLQTGALLHWFRTAPPHPVGPFHGRYARLHLEEIERWASGVAPEARPGMDPGTTRDGRPTWLDGARATPRALEALLDDLIAHGHDQPGSLCADLARRPLRGDGVVAWYGPGGWVIWIGEPRWTARVIRGIARYEVHVAPDPGVPFSQDGADEGIPEGVADAEAPPPSPPS